MERAGESSRAPFCDMGGGGVAPGKGASSGDAAAAVAVVDLRRLVILRASVSTVFQTIYTNQPGLGRRRCRVGGRSGGLGAHALQSAEPSLDGVLRAPRQPRREQRPTVAHLALELQNKVVLLRPPRGLYGMHARRGSARFPHMACKRGTLEMDGSKLQRQRSRHCLGVRPGTEAAALDQLMGFSLDNSASPESGGCSLLIASRSFWSSSLTHGPFFRPGLSTLFHRCKHCTPKTVRASSALAPHTAEAKQKTKERTAACANDLGHFFPALWAVDLDSRLERRVLVFRPLCRLPRLLRKASLGQRLAGGHGKRGHGLRLKGRVGGREP